jgi:hypothetical protein
MRSLVSAALLLAVAACGSAEPEARIDGASFGQYQASLDVMREQTRGPDAFRFEAAFRLIQADVFRQAKDREEFNRLMRERLNGKNAADIIAMGDGLKDGLGNRAADAAFEAKKALGDAAAAVSSAEGIAGQAADIAKGAAGAAMDEAKAIAKQEIQPVLDAAQDPKAAAEAAARKAVQDAAQH